MPGSAGLRRPTFGTPSRSPATSAPGSSQGRSTPRPGGSPDHARLGEQRQRAAEGFHALGPELDRAGVDMAIEPMNRYETFFLNTAADGNRAL